MRKLQIIRPAAALALALAAIVGCEKQVRSSGFGGADYDAAERGVPPESLWLDYAVGGSSDRQSSARPTTQHRGGATVATTTDPRYLEALQERQQQQREAERR